MRILPGFSWLHFSFHWPYFWW